MRKKLDEMLPKEFRDEIYNDTQVCLRLWVVVIQGLYVVGQIMNIYRDDY